MGRITGLATLAALIALSWSVSAADAPRFEVDAAWPKALPNNWIMGQAAGVDVDGGDHIWVIQRPKTLTADEKTATLNPPTSKCCAPTPPVLESAQDGTLLHSWGGPGQGYDCSERAWPSISIRKASYGSLPMSSRM